jgi:uroporphyrinogen III methyltransferase / synthase
MAAGMVYLVGAGPGDPGLITVRAREHLERCDVVVYDYLVHPALLASCRPEARRIYVGKKAGFHSRPQDEIEEILVREAQAGHCVVRLKGGDPFVFGRGGEEARRLAAAGIPFAVVPGVTAALAAGAYGGVPLTLRSTSASVVFLTGHEDPSKGVPTTDWRRFGALPDATLVIYMAMGHLRQVLQELQAGGLSSATPAVVVQWASLGRQRSIAAPVGKLADAVDKAELTAPAIVIIGDVVKEKEALGWFERLPLFGRRVVVTRAGTQASALREKLEALGAEVLELPLIAITKDVSKHDLAEVLPELGGYDWLVFTSPNGVRFFFEEFRRIFDDIRSLGLIRIACVGEATAREVASLHLRVELQPEVATAESLAEALIATGSLDSAKVLVVTGNRNRDTLVRALDEARAIVDLLPVYRTDLTDLSDEAAAADFRTRGADAVLFASSSAVESFTQQAKHLQLAPGVRRPLAGSIGPQTSASLKAAGLQADFEAKKPGLDELVSALIQALQRPRRAS